MLFCTIWFHTSLQAGGDAAGRLLQKAHDLTEAGKFDSASICYSGAEQLFREAEDWEGVVASENGAGDIFFRLARWDEADRRLGEALRLAGEHLAPASPVRAVTLYLLGSICAYRGRVDSALALTMEARSIASRSADSAGALMVNILTTEGYVHRQRGEFAGALEDYLNAERLASASEGNNPPPEVVEAVGRAYADCGRIDSSIAVLSRLHDRLDADTKDTLAITERLDFYLGDDYIILGDYDRALHYMKAAETLGLSLYGERHPNIAATYSKIGKIYSLTGDYDCAILYLRRSVAIAEANLTEPTPGTAEIYALLATLYGQTGLRAEALQFAKKGLAVQEKLFGPSHPSVGLACRSVAAAYGMDRRFDSALVYYNRSVRILRSAGSDPNDLAAVECERGRSLLAAGRRREANASFMSALGILERSPSPSPAAYAETYLGLGDAATAPADAASWYHRVADIRDSANVIPMSSQATAFSRLAAMTEADNGRASESTERLRTALGYASNAVDRVCTIRRSYTSGASKLFLAERAHGIFEQAVHLSYALYERMHDRKYLDDAFRAIELSKAGALEDDLQNAEAFRRAGLSDSLLTVEQRLREASYANATEFERRKALLGSKDRELVRLERRTFDATNAYRAFVESIECLYPKYRDVKEQAANPDLGALQKKLPRGTSLVEYFATDSVWYLLSATSEQARMTRIAKGQSIESEARAMLHAIKSIDGAAYAASAARLYHTALGPMTQGLRGIDHLIVVPDGILYYVPFASLLTSPARSGAIDYTQLPYLLRECSVSYAYSSSFFLNEQQQTEQNASQSGFAGFAPVFDDSTSSTPALALRDLAAEKESGDEFRSFTLDGKRFNELKYSREEVETIVGDFERSGRQATGFLYSGASEGSFKKNAGRYAFLHIATHGYANEARPDLSALLFAPMQSAGDTDDGILYAGEIYGLRLNAELVVLSSCESGIGRIVKGEGVVALTRGFFTAGARNVMCSLWKIPDKPTGQLMAAFYGRLLSGQSFADALREAELRMISNPSTAFPSLWSGFMLMGG